MAYTSTQPLTLSDFLAQYRDNPRYELADGELIDMEPTGPHKTVGGKLATQLGYCHYRGAAALSSRRLARGELVMAERYTKRRGQLGGY
jgi:Uma2 family endonuclease